MAALLVPQILTVIQVTFNAAERSKAYAAYGACAAVATVSGPLLGGVLVQADLFGLGWRPIFLVNVVLGSVALACVATWLPESRAEDGLRLDLPGVLLLTAALALVLYPLTRAAQGGHTAQGGHAAHGGGVDLALVALGVVMLAVFAVHQRRRRRPLIPLEMFGQRALTGGVATQFALYAGVTGFFLVLALTVETGYGFSPLHAGLTFLPFSACIAVASGAAGGLASRLGRRLTTTGVAAMAAGMAGVLAAVRLAGPVPGTWPLAPGLALAGVGMGLVAPTLVDVTLVHVRPSDAGAASGIITTAGQLGGAFGVAAIGAVFFHALSGARSASAYNTAFTDAVIYEIGVFVFAALLTFLLPTPRASA
jgi:MFS family permease